MAKRLLRVVTVTGADDSIKPEELLLIAKDFPFVEFGILLSKKQQGNKRFPSRKWLEELYIFWRENKLVLSGHLCGSWVRDLCLGKPSFFNDFGYIWVMFARIQLNFHGEPHDVDYPNFSLVIRHRIFPKPIIFQMDGTANESMFYSMEGRHHISSHPLFDMSGGCGVLPKQWPKQFNNYCGYAGGLSPENLHGELGKISRIANGPIWIDAEAMLRSEDDWLFDLKKVRCFLKAAEPWVID